MALGKNRTPEGRRRGLLVVVGVFLMTLAGAFTAFTDVAPGDWRAVDITRAAAFVLLAIVLSVRSTSSFSVVGRNSVLDDELTRANRASAARFGFWALMLGVLASFVASIWLPLTLAQIAPVLVALGAAAATLRFVVLERSGDA